MKRLLSVLIVFAMILSLSACGGDSTTDTTTDASSADGSAVVANSVNYALRNTSWDLSPWKNNGSSANTMCLQLYSGLMANPEFGTVLEDMHYDMAESISFSDDNLTATVKLRDYIHDAQGNPINAEDVVFSYQTAPTISGVYAHVESLLDSITALDEYTVEMKLKALAPGNWESVLSNCPVISKSWYESASDDDKANDPATTGAYRIKENITGTSVTMEAVEDFWQQDELRSIYQIVNAKTLYFVSIPEDAMRAIALENGEVDMAYLEASNYSRFADDSDYNLFSTVMSNPSTIILNCAEGKLLSDNAALRNAILHALDFEQMGIACSGQFTFQSHDIASLLCNDYDSAWDDQPYFEYDVALAKQYLTEAGYNENSGLTLHIMCRNVGGQKSAMVVAQSNLDDIGINLIIDAYDQALYDTYLTDSTQWDLVFYTTNMTTGYVTESWNNYFGSKGENGTVGFVKDDKLQELLDAAKNNDDADSRNAFRDYYMDQGYGANAFMETTYQFARSYITDVTFNYLGNLSINTSVFSSSFTR